MKVTQTALKRPVAVAVLTIAVAAVGFFCLKNLAVDYLPNITYPMIKVHIWWPGATPEEIETNIAEPIERVMATVDDLDYIESSSIEGMYTLLVNFGYGVDVEAAYQDVLAVMGRVARKLPTGMDPPVVIKADPSQQPVMQITLSSDQHSLVWLRDWADNWLTDRITAVPGTAGVEVVGGLKREIRVLLDPQRLTAYGISPARVARLLADENQEMFSGRITVGTHEIVARTMGEFESLAEISNLVVARGKTGEPVYLKELAAIEDGHEEMRVNTLFNGKACVKLSVLKQAEANTVVVSRAVQGRLNKLKAELPPGIVLGVVENQGNYIMAAIRSVESSAIIAAILVILVIYFFLGRWRQVAVMAVALPVTLLANFFLMKVAGFSINLFSLGGLVVSLGVILDNSIVVLENMTRLKAEGRPDWAIQGVNEVGTAIVAATLTFLSLFLPFLFVPGLAVLLFKELVLVVAGIVVISLVVAVTLTPVLTHRLLRSERADRVSFATRTFESLIGMLTRLYERALSLCLEWKRSTVAVTVLLFCGGLMLAAWSGSEFLPKVKGIRKIESKEVEIKIRGTEMMQIFKFAALYITGTPLGVTVLIGLVIMMGGITSQGVVLLSLAETYRTRGLTPAEAIEKASPVRVRPILMTQLTTVLGLIPLAINLGEGGDMLQPMAIAVIGGLTYSLTLTLFFLPSAYVIVLDRRKHSVSF